MCNFCEQKQILFETDVIHRCSWMFSDIVKITERQAVTYRLGCFIDNRGFLRMANLDDCNCLDSGYKIAIKFCPFCGNQIEEK